MQAFEHQSLTKLSIEQDRPDERDNSKIMALNNSAAPVDTISKPKKTL